MICFGFIVRFLLCSSTSHKHSLVGRHANGVHTFAGGESEPTTPHLFTQSVILPTKLKKKKKKRFYYVQVTYLSKLVSQYMMQVANYLQIIYTSGKYV